MDQLQHYIQDAGEAYAVAIMQEVAEKAGRAPDGSSAAPWQAFLEYLAKVNVSYEVFSAGKYAAYKHNADRHIPTFVDRLMRRFPDDAMSFVDVEREYRNLGLKADFLVLLSSGPKIPVSLKNYIGASGIARPQVASGTFNSFVLSFLFDRAGAPGGFLDQTTKTPFRGANKTARDAALRRAGYDAIVPLMAELDALQALIRSTLLGPDHRFYDKEAIAALAEEIGHRGVDLSLAIFEQRGIAEMRHEFVKRIGLDGAEEALFFDRVLYTDSITNLRYHELIRSVNDPAVDFVVTKRGKGLEFAFWDGDRRVLRANVPYTINTNGAWWRPAERFDGERQMKDKGKLVSLRYGERRPNKSKEISTSVNTYVEFQESGIFDAYAAGVVDIFEVTEADDDR